MPARSEPLLWVQLIGAGVFPLEGLLLLLLLAGSDPGPVPSLERLLCWALGALAPTLLLWHRPADVWSLLLLQTPLRARRPLQQRLSRLQDNLGLRLALALAGAGSLPLLWWLDEHAAIASSLSPLQGSPRLVDLLLAALLLALMLWQWQQLVQALFLLSRSPEAVEAARPFAQSELEERRLCLGLPLLLLEPLQLAQAPAAAASRAAAMPQAPPQPAASATADAADAKASPPAPEAPSAESPAGGAEPALTAEEPPAVSAPRSAAGAAEREQDLPPESASAVPALAQTLADDAASAPSPLALTAPEPPAEAPSAEPGATQALPDDDLPPAAAAADTSGLSESGCWVDGPAEQASALGTPTAADTAADCEWLLHDPDLSVEPAPSGEAGPARDPADPPEATGDPAVEPLAPEAEAAASEAAEADQAATAQPGSEPQAAG